MDTEIRQWSAPETWRHGEATEKRNDRRVIARVVHNRNRGCSFHIYDATGQSVSVACADLNDGMRRADELLHLA